MLKRPMLAASLCDSDSLQFPLLATPKIDGVRALIVDGKLVSRSFRRIPNEKIRATLEALLPEGADGELQAGTLYDTTSLVMSRHAEADTFTFYWFDWAYDLKEPYERRAAALANIATSMRTNFVVPLIPVTVNNTAELRNFESRALDDKHEGVVVRKPDGGYKCGRATLREGLMIKIKREHDYDAIIVGTEELMRNLNDAQADNFGNAKRGSAKHNLVPAGTLGSIVARCDAGIFRVGTGFDADQRDALWANRDAIIGQLVKYRCAGFGSRGTPRSPVFHGLRHRADV